jgi:hypothetical protein
VQLLVEWALQAWCTGGRITYIDMDHSGLPGGVIPLALLDLTGLETLSFGGDGLPCFIPAAIGQLQQLSYLVLWVNDLHGKIPQELTALHKLVDTRLPAVAERCAVPTSLCRSFQKTSRRKRKKTQTTR